jgi:hypothetical protein
MRKIDLIYLNIISLLYNLTTDSDNFVALHAILDEDQQNKLIDISEQIAVEQRGLIDAYKERAFYPDFTNLKNLIIELDNTSPGYPNFRNNEILAIISVIQKLTTEFGGSDTLNLEETIIPWDFEIIELHEDTVQENFLQFDSSDITYSLFLFNINNSEGFKNYIDSINSGVNILYYLLAKLGGLESPLVAPKYILVKPDFATKPNTVWATLSLHIIKSGAFIHSSYEYVIPPKVPKDYSIILGKNYQQFSDSIGILSEYNFQKDILDKYLRIYHVLENFMYKSPLVTLERESAGDVFSIRDFKRMYDRINDSELNMLKKLFDTILLLDYSPGMTFTSKILDDWKRLIPNSFVDDTKINFLTNILNIHTSKGKAIPHADVNADMAAGFITKLIYAFRNSMVHNRETEFHLTHQTLLRHPVIGNAALIILENFLLPILEEIAFYLIINENEIVWYDTSILKLWDEN